MTYKEFEELFDKRVAALKETSQTKGRKYTAGSEDRLKNFKGCMPRLDPLHVWEVFFRKHWTSIEYFLNTGENIGEDICDTHINDCIMYLFLLEGLIREERLVHKEARR
jgi:hypothetical protein